MMNVAGMIGIPRDGISPREAVDAVVSGRIFGKNGGRFSEPIGQAIVEGDRDVYAAFAKLPDASSRIFTAGWPDSLQMKVGAILDLTVIDQPTLVAAGPRSLGMLLGPHYR